MQNCEFRRQKEIDAEGRMKNAEGRRSSAFTLQHFPFSVEDLLHSAFGILN
jgi:hypothetical protein